MKRRSSPRGRWSRVPRARGRGLRDSSRGRGKSPLPPTTQQHRCYFAGRSQQVDARVAIIKRCYSRSKQRRPFRSLFGELPSKNPDPPTSQGGRHRKFEAELGTLAVDRSLARLRSRPYQVPYRRSPAGQFARSPFHQRDVRRKTRSACRDHQRHYAARLSNTGGASARSRNFVCEGHCRK